MSVCLQMSAGCGGDEMGVGTRGAQVSGSGVNRASCTCEHRIRLILKSGNVAVQSHDACVGSAQ